MHSVDIVQSLLVHLEFLRQTIDHELSEDIDVHQTENTPSHLATASQHSSASIGFRRGHLLDQSRLRDFRHVPVSILEIRAGD